MKLDKYFKSIVDSDIQPIVICNTDSEIIYLNKAAEKRYAESGGKKLIGKSIFDCHGERSGGLIRKRLEMMKNDPCLDRIFEVHSTAGGADCDVFMTAVRDEDGKLIGYYEKFEDRKHYIKEK